MTRGSLPKISQIIADLRLLSPLYLQFNRAIKKNKKNDDQMKFVLDSGDELSSADQEYNISGHINDIRELVDQ